MKLEINKKSQKERRPKLLKSEIKEGIITKLKGIKENYKEMV